MRRAALGACVAVGGAAACLDPVGAARVPSLPGTHNVLFVGNSQTYVNDLPSMVWQLARTAGDSSLGVLEVSLPDYALEDHYKQGVVGRVLAASRFEWVVLQQGPSALPESQANLLQWTQAFAPLVRASGAEPVLYQIWPNASRRFDAEAALTSYWNAAAAVGGILAPAGDAFTVAMDSIPEAAPYAADGLHASREGTYLAALTILQRTLGVAPTALPPVIPGANADTSHVRALQRAAEAALARSPGRPAGPRTDG